MTRTKGSPNKEKKLTIAKIAIKIKRGEPLSPEVYRYYSLYSASILKEVNKNSRRAKESK